MPQTDLVNLWTGGWFLGEHPVQDEILSVFTDGWFGSTIPQPGGTRGLVGGSVVPLSTKELEEEEILILLIGAAEC